ncbi:MAG: acyl carrier protein, partial [Clostridiales bacterium]|nr:acyl carrier protein [Clostridiales bacterium]
SSQFGIDEDQITEDTDIIDDLGADSLDVMEMMMGLEDEFSLSISEDTVSSLRTVGDVVRLIEGLM